MCQLHWKPVSMVFTYSITYQGTHVACICTNHTWNKVQTSSTTWEISSNCSREANYCVVCRKITLSKSEARTKNSNNQVYFHSLTLGFLTCGFALAGFPRQFNLRVHTLQYYQQNPWTYVLNNVFFLFCSFICLSEKDYWEHSTGSYGLDFDMYQISSKFARQFSSSIIRTNSPGLPYLQLENSIKSLFKYSEISCGQCAVTYLLWNVVAKRVYFPFLFHILWAGLAQAV